MGKKTIIEEQVTKVEKINKPIQKENLILTRKRSTSFH